MRDSPTLNVLENKRVKVSNCHSDFISNSSVIAKYSLWASVKHTQQVLEYLSDEII